MALDGQLKTRKPGLESKLESGDFIAEPDYRGFLRISLSHFVWRIAIW